ncbi:hypothetical protein [Haladaptatus pallidirubidus]|uniref:Uncharacterized protein n=3 Tax=Haladaptatus pallidirubidus TaxID=1008152 RepID=A0AAV3UPV5_9EURY
MTDLFRDKMANSARRVSHTLLRWPAWAAYAASAWSLIYGALGIYWTFGGSGFPFGAANDPEGAALSILAGVQVETAAPVIAAMGLVGAVVGLAMAWTWGRGFSRTVLLGIAWSFAAVLLLVVPDARGLLVTALVPIVLIGAPFGWPSENFFDAIPWPVMNQFVLTGGGFLWVAAAVAYQRRSRNACMNCGRSDTDTGWTTPAAAARWGRWATAVAAIVPLVYATTRLAWELGIPLGISEEILRTGQAGGGLWSGVALSTVAVGGAIFTLGLIQPWGEIFPRWLPLLGGKRVSIWLAVVPASLVSVLVAMAGLMFVRKTVLGNSFFTLTDGWAAIGPVLLWPIWGVALGAATLAYYYRRRGRCRHCGLGRTITGGN